MEEKWMDMLETKESESLGMICVRGDEGWMCDVLEERYGRGLLTRGERGLFLRDLWSGGERRWRDGGGQREERSRSDLRK